MDYKTKPISREDLRVIAIWFRSIFKCKNTYRFDVIGAFEKIHLLIPQITTEIIEDDDISVINGLTVPSACIPDFNGNYHVVIRQKIYDGANDGVGGYRDHIMHEMSHAILCLLGFTPILERAFKNNEINPCYTSMEWQAKALTGEMLIPYEKTIGMSSKMIRFKCGVSMECANKRFRMEHPDSRYG